MKFRFIILILTLTGCVNGRVQDTNEQGSYTSYEENAREVENISLNSISEKQREDADITEEGYVTYIVELNYNEEEVNEAKFRFILEKELNTYSIDRHQLVFKGNGTNDLWGDIKVDFDFEYPQISGIQDEEIQTKINERILVSFFYKSSLEQIMGDELFEGTNRHESGTYKIEYADNDTLCISGHTNYSTGSSPAKNTFGLTFAVKDGNLLSLGDFVDYEYIRDRIHNKGFEIVGDEVGVGGSKATDDINIESFIEYIAETYSFDEVSISNETAFSYDINGFYIDEKHIYIYMSFIESYGRDFFIKIPLTYE